jgi:hypothetical protein
MVLIINTMTRNDCTLFIWSFRQRPTGNRYYKFSGPRFADVDNRLMSLQLVKNGMTDAVMFDPQGRNIPAAILYKRIFLL